MIAIYVHLAFEGMLFKIPGHKYATRVVTFSAEKLGTMC